jgi:CcmD family protein
MIRSHIVRLCIIAAGLLAPAALQAQEKMEGMGQVSETIPAGPFLAGAYAFIWTAVLVYLISVARRLTRVQSEIADLRRRLERPRAHSDECPHRRISSTFRRS